VQAVLTQERTASLQANPAWQLPALAEVVVAVVGGALTQPDPFQ